MDDKISEQELEKSKALSERDELWEQKWKEMVRTSVVYENLLNWAAVYFLLHNYIQNTLGSV